MAYEVTATRRRPKTFNDLAGQEFVVSTLKSAIESGRIAHAYLFSGPRGCGKTSAARILARSLNCEKGPTSIPCGTCPPCVEIARGASMDVIEIDGASNTSVNDVRQIKDEVLFPPNSGRYKIYIIDEVHMLSNSAFNALLKTIEEPPPYIIFIFATTELHKVPATIKSRCQQFNFRLIPIDLIKSLLADTCVELGVQAEDEALFWIAKESTGSLRDAYTLLDQIVAFSDGNIRAELIREKLGVVGLDAVNDLAEACALGDTKRALEAVDAVMERGVSIEQFVVDLAEYFRSLLLLKNGIEREALLGYSPDRYSRTAIATFSPVQVERAVSILLDLYRDMRFSVSPRFELETAVSRLCWLNKWVSPAELRTAIDDVRGCLLIPHSNVLHGPPEKTQSPGEIMSESVIEAPSNSKADPITDFSRPGGLTEGFKRFLADREARSSPDAMLVAVPASAIKVIPAAEMTPTVQASNTENSVQKSETPVVIDPKVHFPAPSEYDYVDDDDDDDDEGNAAPSFNLIQQPVVSIPEVQPEKSSASLPNSPGSWMGDVKTRVVGVLKKERGMLASTLEKTDVWMATGKCIVIPTADGLAADMLKKDQTAIVAALQDIVGKDHTVEITVSQGIPSQNGTGKQGKADIHPQVEMVRQLFRGTIVRNPGE